MIKTDGSGYGREYQLRDNRGDGVICGDSWGAGDGHGHGCGQLDGDGWGHGYLGLRPRGVSRRDSVYITVLVINSDPITTAYQAHTMQTTGEVDDQN